MEVGVKVLKFKDDIVVYTLLDLLIFFVFPLKTSMVEYCYMIPFQKEIVRFQCVLYYTSIQLII